MERVRRVLIVMQDIQPGALSAGVAAGLAAIGLLLALVRVKSVRQTTLIYPWVWTIISLTAVAGVEIVAGVVGWPARSRGLEAFRFIASVSTFCPAMALLGAKRPQDQVWQFSVVSLWAVLALPAVQVLALGQSTFHVPGIQCWFMLILLTVSTANSIPTRFGLSAALVLVSQWGLLGDKLPIWSAPTGTGIRLASLICVLLAIGLAAARLPPRRSTAEGLDRAWVDFRDTFGMLWAMRVAERVNAAASHSGWNVSLSRNGFHSNTRNGQPLAAHDAAAVSKVFRALLRRFVSKQWIAERLATRTEE